MIQRITDSIRGCDDVSSLHLNLQRVHPVTYFSNHVNSETDGFWGEFAGGKSILTISLNTRLVMCW